MKENRVTIPGYSMYTIDLDTTHIYNKHGRKMSTFLNKRGHKQVGLMNDKGARKSLTVEPLVLKLLQAVDNRTETERILSVYFELLSPDNIDDHRLNWTNRIMNCDNTLDRKLVISVLVTLQTGE